MVVIIGFLFAVGSGLSIPLMVLLFGQLTDQMILLEMGSGACLRSKVYVIMSCPVALSQLYTIMQISITYK